MYPNGSLSTNTSHNNGSKISNLSAETFASLLFGPLLEISVGPSKKRWHLHLNLLRYHSDFFDRKRENRGDEKVQDNGAKENVNGDLDLPTQGEQDEYEHISNDHHKDDSKPNYPNVNHNPVVDDGNDGNDGNDDDEDEDGGKLDLPNEDPAAFRVFVKWLYQGHIEDVSTITSTANKRNMPTNKSKDSNERTNGIDGDNKPKESDNDIDNNTKDQNARETAAKWNYTYTCLHLHLLATHLRMPTLQNLSIDQFRRGCNITRLVPGAEEILPIYARTEANSPFRKLVSRIAARQIMDPDVKRDAGVYGVLFERQPDFAVDVLNAIREGTGGLLMDDPTESNGCRWHIHGEGESCVKSVRFEEG